MPGWPDANAAVSRSARGTALSDTTAVYVPASGSAAGEDEPAQPERASAAAATRTRVRISETSTCRPGSSFTRTGEVDQIVGTPGGARTPDLNVRSVALYPTELQARAETQV